MTLGILLLALMAMGCAAPLHPPLACVPQRTESGAGYLLCVPVDVDRVAPTPAPPANKPTL